MIHFIYFPPTPPRAAPPPYPLNFTFFLSKNKIKRNKQKMSEIKDAKINKNFKTHLNKGSCHIGHEGVDRAIRVGPLE